MLYRLIYRTLLVHTNPERAHHVAMRAIEKMGKSPFASLVGYTIGRRGGVPVEGLLARPVPGRVGLAAGQDKDAKAVLGLDALGFAFVEVGTITPEPQDGNEPPRLWRHNDIGAFRNRMGFNNEGAEAAAARLAELRAHPRGAEVIVGVNIGKNKWTSAEDAPKDYYACAKALAQYADFLVINVSSPNTPGLRDLQAVDSLREIAQATKDGARDGGQEMVPILIKLAPDLSDEDVYAASRLVITDFLAGVVATNTTIDHDLGEGGLSGRPVHKRALEVVSIARSAMGSSPMLIGVGGVFTEEDANEMLDAGANFVEVLTGFVTEGPLMPGKLNRALAVRRFPSSRFWV